MPSPNRIDRRHFAAQLAVGASALTAAMTPLAAASAAEDQPVAEKNEKGDKPAEKPPDEASVPPELPSAEIVLLTYLTRRHPSDHYDEAALQGIYRDIRGDVARGKQLSEFPLTNADEPAFVFAAYRNNEESGVRSQESE